MGCISKSGQYFELPESQDLGLPSPSTHRQSSLPNKVFCRVRWFGRVKETSRRIYRGYVFFGALLYGPAQMGIIIGPDRVRLLLAFYLNLFCLPTQFCSIVWRQSSHNKTRLHNNDYYVVVWVKVRIWLAIGNFLYITNLRLLTPINLGWVKFWLPQNIKN